MAKIHSVGLNGVYTGYFSRGGSYTDAPVPVSFIQSIEQYGVYSTDLKGRRSESGRLGLDLERGH